MRKRKSVFTLSWLMALSFSLSLLGAVPAGAQRGPDLPPQAAPQAQRATQSSGPASPHPRVLLYTGTEGRQATQGQPAEVALRVAAVQNGLLVEESKRNERLTETRLRRFDAVVFLNTAGTALSAQERTAFEAYYRDGGGFVAVGSAIETAPDWDFMTDLLGTRASGQASAQEATVKVADRVHPAGQDLPEYWEGTDAWYDFEDNVRGFLHVLATVDENTYDGGGMGYDHPIAWCQDFAGGRSFYTGRGVTAASFADDDLLSHVVGAITWAAGGEGDCGATVLANYEETVIAENTLEGGTGVRNAGGIDTMPVGEPIGIDVLPDGRVIQTLRTGPTSGPGTPRGPAEVRLHDPEAGTSTTLAQIPVYDHSEDGMYGPAIDNDFEDNGWVYLFYAPVEMDPPFPATTPSGAAPNFSTDPDAWDEWRGYFQLSRFQFVDGANPHLDLDSEQKILQVPVQRGACCHVAGDIEFDSNNNLVLSTGDDTPAGGPNVGGHAPINDAITADGLYYAPHLDARRTAGNTNDLMGKILRITVQEDGSYTVPDDNLFNSGEFDDLFPGGEYDPELARPEIYAMGLRNPFKIHLDAEDTLYVTDYSNDSTHPDPLRGPPGTGQVIVMEEPGNYGWPYCEEPHLPYIQFDFATLESGDPFDCSGPTNDSRHNTGLTELPPVQPALIWYARNRTGPDFPPRPVQQTPCPEYYLTGGPENDCPNQFPELETGRVAPHGAIPYDYDPDSTNPDKFPEYYDGSIFFGEFTRNYLKEIRLDEDGNLFKINDLLNCSAASPAPPGRPFQCNSPMDFAFHDGEFYLLTYGSGFFNQNTDAKLSKFSYVGND